MKSRRAPTQGSRAGRKRRGRPPGPANRVRPHRVVTFVTGGEIQRLKELAEVSGRSLSAVVHGLLALSLKQTGVQVSNGRDEEEKPSMS